MATMQVSVVSAEKELYSGEAAEVYARTTEGELGILPGHQPLLASLEIAPVRLKKEDGSWEAFAVHEGTIFFRDDNLVVLADIAEHQSEIDIERARRETEELSGRRGELEDEAAKALRRAQVRLTVADTDGPPTGSP